MIADQFYFILLLEGFLLMISHDLPIYGEPIVPPKRASV